MNFIVVTQSQAHGRDSLRIPKRPKCHLEGDILVEG